MAANAVMNRPLLVVHDEEEGHLVYDLFLVLDGGEESSSSSSSLACFPRPVAHFPAPLGCRALAVSGGAVLGVFYDSWNDTIVRDTALQFDGGSYGVPWPTWRSFTESRPMGLGHTHVPAMIPMADGTVIRMDRVLLGGIYCFEALRLLPGGGGCHAVPLPKPPISYLDGVDEKELVWVPAYFSMGTRVWISAERKGTFSFDTGDGTWRVERSWQLPFEGRALYVPELAAVFGLSAETQLLCAYDFVAGTTPPVMRHVCRETGPLPSEDCVVYTAGDQQEASKPRDVPSLAYLGNGRFCICRPMSVMEPFTYGPPMKYNAASFLVVSLRRSPSGELRLVRRGKTSYMHWAKGPIPYLGFIQPAI